MEILKIVVGVRIHVAANRALTWREGGAVLLKMASREAPIRKLNL